MPDDGLLPLDTIIEQEVHRHLENSKMSDQSKHTKHLAKVAKEFLKKHDPSEFVIDFRLNWISVDGVVVPDIRILIEPTFGYEQRHRNP